MKTEVTDTLDAAGIDYEIKTHAQPALTCETAAAERGVRVSQIVKCMVGEIDGGQLVVMLIPGDKTLKSSKARKAIKAGTLNLVDPARLAEDLGLIVGAISPIQLMDKARILMDPSVLNEDVVDISSGDPLAGVELRSTDLQQLLGATMIEMVSLNS